MSGWQIPYGNCVWSHLNTKEIVRDRHNFLINMKIVKYVIMILVLYEPL